MLAWWHVLENAEGTWVFFQQRWCLIRHLKYSSGSALKMQRTRRSHMQCCVGKKNTVYLEASSSRISWRQEQNLRLKRHWEARWHRYCMNFNFILTITSHGQILRKGVTWWDPKLRKISLISVAGSVGLPVKWWGWAMQLLRISLILLFSDFNYFFDLWLIL